MDGTAGRVRTCPCAVCELWRAGHHVRLARGVFSTDPSYERDRRSRLGLRQQRRSYEILELLGEIRVAQQYVGPERASVFRIDHHRAPEVSQHQIGRGQTG